MSLKLRMVPNFGSYPDGRMRCGPFKMNDMDVLAFAMDHWGIRPGYTGAIGLISETIDGLMLSAAGREVTGYLIDHEDYEVDADTLNEFVMATVNPGTPWKMNGHWCPDTERMIISDACAIHDGTGVKWSTRRYIQHRDGRRHAISDEKPALFLHRAA